MITTKYSSDKRARLSESKQGQRKDQTQKRSVGSNNRTSSVYRGKKPERLQTDYGEYDSAYTANITNYPKFHNKVARRRDTFECAIERPYLAVGVHSTKYNPRKNMEIKNIFKDNNKVQDNSVTRKGKPTMGNHPLLKFIGKKYNQHQHHQPKRDSLVSKDKERFYSMNSHNLSVSVEKQKKVSLAKKPQLSINKHQISLRGDVEDGGKDRRRQKSGEERGGGERAVREEVKKDEQWTMKTVKKQREDSVRSNQSFGLTQEEEQTFGDRFPYGFDKVKLLGRGGFSLVWLGKHIKSGRQFAVKQIITQNTHQTHIKQIWFGTLFFSLGGVPKPEYAKVAGVKNLVRLYSYQINQSDTWIFYEKCGQSLGSVLYDIKSERLYGEQKLYKIHYKQLYREMAARPSLLLELVVQICRALALLSQCEVVHSDLKTQNILLKVQGQGSTCGIKEVKLIDYGSSFEFKNLAQFSMATPEYMPPEILNYIIHENGGDYEQQLYQRVMEDYRRPWAVDMWSLGCVLLQIVVGVPLWMSLPLLVPGKNGSWLQKEGLFAVKGRLFPQIIKKQRSINPLLDDILQHDNFSGITLSAKSRSVVCRMLQIDFNQRISPEEVIDILSQELTTLK